MEKIDEMDIDRLYRKADQHWEMAGLARIDGDKKDEERHTKLAKEYDDRIRELNA